MGIVPLQQDLDFPPLPSDATEFLRTAQGCLPNVQRKHSSAYSALYIEGCIASKSSLDDKDDDD